MITANSKMTIIRTVFAVIVFFFPVAEGGADQKYLLHNDAKVEDAETGLVWAIDAGTPSFKDCAGGKKTYPEAVDYVTCLNFNNYLGHGDWRLPSPQELSSLISVLAHQYKKEHTHEIAGPKLRELGFNTIQPSLYWSRSVTDEVALAVEVLTSGEFHPIGKLNALYVWPVRGGAR